MLETLKNIGLEKKKAKIYLACLKLGETTIVEIARKTGIKRTTVYENLNEMINEGFVKVSPKGKRKHFIALEPQELKALIKKREALLDQIMPELNAINNVNATKPKIWFYQGKAGILEAYEDSLNYSGTEVFGWASGEVLKMFSQKEIEKYITKRQRRKIMQTLIMPDDKNATEFTLQDSQQLRKTKTISAEEYPFKIEINTYANRVALFSVNDKMAVILESEFISSAMRMIFRMCWKGIT